MRKLPLFLFLLFPHVLACAAGERLFTRVFDPEVASLQVLLRNEQLSAPVIELGNPEDYITIGFDQFGYDAAYYNYRVVHLNSDWTESALPSMEAIDGVDNGYISSYQYSVGTTVNYIHYSLTFPNEDTRFLASGNYAVLIARDGDFDNGVVATACFSVLENLCGLNAEISGNTQLELNGRYQQISVETDVAALQSPMLSTEFRLVVVQNSRYDTEVCFDRPSYINGTRLTYASTRDLVFEGGNQYRSIDFSSRYTYGSGIDSIEMVAGEYHVVLEPQQVRAAHPNTFPYDVHGDYAVNYQHGSNPDIEADYMWVHFALPTDRPFLRGPLFLIGAMTGNLASDKSLVPYDHDVRAYVTSLFLKQGGYNYVFALNPKGSGKLTVEPTEGSFYTAVNRYELFLYYRPFGARYDRLVGYKRI